MTTTQASHDLPAIARTSPLGEIFAGLVIIIASIYLIAPTYEGMPAITAGYGVTLAAIARHMWKHAAPRSLPILCMTFAVTVGALAILGAVTSTI